MDNSYFTLARDENQALGLGRYAIEFIHQDLADPASTVVRRLEDFLRDSIACGVSALAAGASAPTILRTEAFDYPANSGRGGATCFGSTRIVAPEKAVLAGCSAVREWDSNGTNFGYNPQRNATCGEFGHNDFYSVPIAAAQVAGLDGRKAMLGMLCLDEIRGRLAEIFALKNHKVDHVVHGAIASAAVYGAMVGATAQQIESAIGLFVAHYIPFRAIRAGKQLSDSKGASAAISAEMAVTSVQRAMRGFLGPADIFRNPEAIFCLFEPPTEKGVSPFDLHLATAGDDFAIQGMHFKLGLYEHQSAGAIGGLIALLQSKPELLADSEQIERIRIAIYQPAFGIIGDPAKRDPRTRQSADHSMVYIIATLLRKAIESQTAGWQELMLLPDDYSDEALFHPATRQIMDKIDFVHGGSVFDDKYPDGIPTTVEIDHAQLGSVSSGMIMYPEGHARCESGNLATLLEHKFEALARPAVENTADLAARFSSLADKSAAEIAQLYDFRIKGQVEA